MNWKLFVLALVLLRAVWDFVLNRVQLRSANNPTPENLKDVYDEKTYDNWKRYSADKCRLNFVSTAVTVAVTVLLLVFNVHAAVAARFGANVYVQMLAVVIFQALVDALCGAAFSYNDSFVIEQKYGFNKSTKKTFVMDQLRGFIINVLLSGVLMALLALLYRGMGDWVVLLFTAAVFLITLVISFLAPYLMRVGNKFVPLEEGELRQKLQKLLTDHGYQVKEIQVMDASRRTTKLNAAFTGFGKTKTVILYDNLLSAMDTDEICAVFAHELGHGLNKDVPKMQGMNLLNLLVMAVTVWLCVRIPGLHEAFGFGEVNYGFAYILLGVGLGIVQPLTGLFMNGYSRRAEFRADHQAVKENYGSALCTALKILARENFAHLAPAKLLVKLEYSHPPIADRIAAIEKAISGK